jgi:hypothetical protein
MVQQEERRGGLSDKLDRVVDLMEAQTIQKEKKKKEFKLPFGVQFGAKPKLKRNFALVVYLRTNGRIKFMLLPIRDEKVYVRETDKFHEVTAGDTFYFKNYPVVIIPEWSLKPFSPREHFDTTVKEKALASPQRVLINAMESSQIKTRGGLGGKAIFIIGVIGVVALYIIVQAFSK